MLFLAGFLEHLKKGFLSIFFVCFILNVSIGSVPKRKNIVIQRNTRVGLGCQFTSNLLSCHHRCLVTNLRIAIFNGEMVFNRLLDNGLPEVKFQF